LSDGIDTRARADALDALDRTRDNEEAIEGMKADVKELTKVVFGGVGGRRFPLVALAWIQTLLLSGILIVLTGVLGMLAWVIGQF